MYRCSKLGGWSPNWTRQSKVKFHYQACSFTLFCQLEEAETQFKPLFLHSLPKICPTAALGTV